MAAPSTYVKLNTHGSISFADGTGTPVTLTSAYDRGDLKIDGLGSKLNDMVHVTRRGKYVSSAFGARRFPTVTFSAWCTNFAGSSASAPGSIMEFLVGLGAYSANVSKLGTGRPMAVNVTLTIEGSNFGDTADESILLANVAITSFSFEESESGNVLSFSGEVLGSVTVTNSTNTVALSEIA
jgi:hypothetical protein